MTELIDDVVDVLVPRPVIASWWIVLHDDSGSPLKGVTVPGSSGPLGHHTIQQPATRQR